jgi:DNA-binding GntR family transcriptional regulator
MHSLAATPPAPTSSLRVYDDLRESILAGQYPPGTRLRTAALAERLGTSRTPIREALVLLEGDGLVVLEPRRGAVVRGFATDDLADLYEVRALLEPHAASRAATRMTETAVGRLATLCDLAEKRGGVDREAIADHIAWNEEFHALIIEAAASARLSAALRSLAGIPRAFRTAFWLSPHQRALSFACHRELHVAIAAGSPERAEATMRMHIVSARDYLIEVMREPRTA